MTPAVLSSGTSSNLDRRSALGQLRDVIALTKPRITFIVVLTTAGGLWLAPGKLGPNVAAFTLLGVVLIVAGANALNMYLERDVDGRMTRTQNRPLPAGRLSPATALAFGVALSAAAVPILAIAVNLTTALLAALANLTYVLAYTPLKQRSHWALFVGAVAGAMPPLLGTTAVTGSVTPTGLVLFGILYFWQIPHFLAISVFRRDEYERGGLKVMPNTAGMAATQHAIARHTMVLVATSLLLVPLGVASWSYGWTAAALGAGFLLTGLAGFRAKVDEKRWARGLFVTSLVYLVALFAALAFLSVP